MKINHTYITNIYSINFFFWPNRELLNYKLNYRIYIGARRRRVYYDSRAENAGR